MLTCLSAELRNKIRNKFEPMYKRKLNEEEIDEIATNLSGLAKAMVGYYQLKQQSKK